MISEPLIYSITKLKLDTELMKLHSYKATNSYNSYNQHKNVKWQYLFIPDKI